MLSDEDRWAIELGVKLLFGGGGIWILWKPLCKLFNWICSRIDSLFTVPVKSNPVKSEPVKPAPVRMNGKVITNERELWEYVIEAYDPVYVFTPACFVGDETEKYLAQISNHSEFRFSVATIVCPRNSPYLWGISGMIERVFCTYGNVYRNGFFKSGHPGEYSGLFLYEPKTGLALEVNPSNESLESLCGKNGTRIGDFLNKDGRYAPLANPSAAPWIPGVFYSAKVSYLSSIEE